VRIIDTAVENRDHNFLAALGLRPSFQCINIGVFLAAILADVVQRPLFGELRVVREAVFAMKKVLRGRNGRFVESDLEVRLGIKHHILHRRVLPCHVGRVSVVKIVDRDEPVYRLDLILHAIVVARGHRFYLCERNARAEPNDDFRLRVRGRAFQG
jgi:hypothetical protein